MSSLRTLFAGAVLAGLPVSAASAQAVVDLTPYQTDIRDQQGRTTCITFAAVAAVEARYKHLGVTVDLSEEFVNYLRKMFWLHPDWSAIAAQGPDKTENQLGATGGGGGTGVLEWMASGLAAPTEGYFPYRTTGWSLPYAWNDPHWQSQRNVNTWNLDPANLTKTALTAPGYYYPTGFQRIQTPASIAAIEGALQNGYEVVWDFLVRGDITGPIWRASSAPSQGGHSMLIVGYDRSSSDPNDHHFVCKNSWGPTANPGGYTYIGYDYIQYGTAAAIVTGAAATPKQWPELQWLGRRKICFDGWQGTLDVYHIPGIDQMHLNNLGGGIIDRRVGTFYDTSGNAHRVNGMAYGKTLHFWFKGSNPNMCYDEERETPTVGRSYVYTIVDTDGDEMAGRHHDNPGLVPTTSYGGYARRPSSMLANDGLLSPVPPPQPSSPEQWLGAWKLQTAGKTMYVRFHYRDDSRLPLQQQWTYAALVGDVKLVGGTSMEILLRVKLASPRSIELFFPHPYYGNVDLEGWMLTWQRGVAAGLAEVGGSPYEAFYMVRYGSFTPGNADDFGSSCGPANYQPYHEVLGLPEVGGPLWFEATNLQPNAITVLALGLSNTSSGGAPLPVDLSSQGMPGCSLYVDPLIQQVEIADGSGHASVLRYFGQPGLLGMHLYSQYFALAPGANALGLISSNGFDLEFGATY